MRIGSSERRAILDAREAEDDPVRLLSPDRLPASLRELCADAELLGSIDAGVQRKIAEWLPRPVVSDLLLRYDAAHSDVAKFLAESSSASGPEWGAFYALRSVVDILRLRGREGAPGDATEAQSEVSNLQEQSLALHEAVARSFGREPPILSSAENLAQRIPRRIVDDVLATRARLGDPAFVLGYEGVPESLQPLVCYAELLGVSDRGVADAIARLLPVEFARSVLEHVKDVEADVNAYIRGGSLGERGRAAFFAIGPLLMRALSRAVVE
jgi:hypothetical protein